MFMHKKPINNKSLSLSKLNCKIEDFSSEILELVQAKSKGHLYTKFVKRFLTYIPVDYRSRDKISLFGDFTDEAFDFFKNRKIDSRKIQVIETEFQNTPAITILVSSENKPFIIDSLNSLIIKLGLHTIFIFHPIIYCTRDREGNLMSILEIEDANNKESLIFIKALGSFEQEKLDTIKTEIHKIVDLVDYAYNSWHALLNKIIVITTDIVHNQDLYKKINLNAEETVDFLNWLQKDNFTFLGMLDFTTKDNEILNHEGIQEVWISNTDEIIKIINFSQFDYYEDKIVMLGKLNKISPIHRNALVDYILVKKLDQKGNYSGGTIIFGLYGTAIYYQSIKSIPILRKKMDYVIEVSGFPFNGYNSKKIKSIIESLPREILIQIDKADLYCMCLHMLSSMLSHKLKLFIQQDGSNSFINVIIFLSRERLTPEAYNSIGKYLSKKFNSEILADNITVVAQNFVHLFTTLAIKNIENLEFSSEEMEKDLNKLTTNWSDSLLQKLCEEYGEYEGGILHREIEPIFPAEYRYKYESSVTIDDFHHLRKATSFNKTVFNLIRRTDDKFSLKFYNPNEHLTLSDTLPLIENLGFTVIDEQSFAIKQSSSIAQSWLYEFKLLSPIDVKVPFSSLKLNIEAALDKIYKGVLTSDSLSKLLVLSGFNWSQVKLLKALTRYLHQTGFIYGKGYVQLTVIKHHKFTEMLVDLFEVKFYPKYKYREEKINKIIKDINYYLEEVTSSAEDKVLRNMYLLIEAIVRTNYYQVINGRMKDYLSFKFDLKKVPDLPLPLPYTEIFVYSYDFEGIHLRGGKVARGGIRWTDRGEDYRTEVLGLVKAQMTKNTVIVPVGSKGTFYINFSQGDLSTEEYMSRVIECYKNFLRGLLDLTDNLVDGKVLKPEKTVIYDDNNPYLVVAADKGTATFSDYANSVSKEYNYWLQDAFASGGSAGYDHKKMGITAKGAWISAQLHFLSMGIDIQREPFTVIGIGDMSGDVFGNGMLLSKCIKLVAAFNHQHIFIDPSPDPEPSYFERARLFKLPRSKWIDYNVELISKGGGIFERSAKYISLSSEIQVLLGINVSVITPDDFIKAILKAEVDLIWNGGIGTYIKSSIENNIDIGDKANDNLRCNGNEIRAKVICEGGNLGVSQLGRIEYAQAGGHINTDFIDNSAGVDCSDHEVNIKIALNLAVAKGKILLEERNKLLAEMTKQVEELVLADNHNQNLALTIAQFTPAVNIENYSQLINELENEQLLNRKVEFLPNKSELAKRTLSKEGLTRAELAVLLSYSKMQVDNNLSNASLADDQYYKKYLFEYFPQAMRERFVDEIKNHPLRKEIISTVITNKMVNQLGGALISDIKRETGGELCDIARSYSVICEIFNLEELWQQVDKLDAKISIPIKVEMFTDLAKIMRRGISWFIRNIKHPINISESVKEYNQQTQKLINMLSTLLVGETKIKFFNKIESYKEQGVSEKLAQDIAILEILISAFDIIYIAKLTNAQNERVANLYFESGDLLYIDWLRKSCEKQINESYWNRLSIQSLKDDFYDKQRRLVTEIIKSGDDNLTIADWLKNNSSYASIFTSFVKDLKIHEVVNLNMIILANKKFEMFLRKLGQ